jgi:hypothetical protein
MYYISVGGIILKGKMLLKSFIKNFWNHIKWVAILLVITLAVVALICFIGNWRSLDSFGKAVLYLGCGYMLIGGASLLGNTGFRQNYAYMQSMTASGKSAYDVGRDNLASTDRSLDFLIRMGITGFIMLMIGTALLGL